MKKIIVLIIIGLALTACASNDVSLKINKKALMVELGEQVSTKAAAYLDKNSDKDVLKNAQISFKKDKAYTVDKKSQTLKSTKGKYLPVGKYKAEMIYEDSKENIIVEVKDTTAPKFVDFKKEVEIQVNSEDVNLISYFKAEDLSTVKISVSGNVDYTKEGVYNITVTAKDTYKNKVSKKAAIKVVAKVEKADDNQTAANQSSNQNAGAEQGTTNSNSTPPSGSSGSGAGSNGNTNTGGPGNSGSGNGDVCVPKPSAGSDGLYPSFDAAVSAAEAFLDSKENVDKCFDGIAGNYAYGYGVFSAGCGYAYVVYDWE